ncbi:MAG TPA: hypothetical protein PKD09_00215 [Aggregatilinea sp.]|uniref:hypothetical protein n=1 Tax=Aggregatilinea sp. TaxID=2806333 RepID=UPI002C4BA7F3|nr:hypothetical protein [Aggregatilinea sp.]HML20038.1 hypothetical protein [Aggregatilinea sp.]
MEPAYIIIAEDGHITLFAGDGTEPEPPVIWRGPVALDGPQIAQVIEEMVQWATENGYAVVLPPYELPEETVEIEPLEQDYEVADEGEIDQMLDDLYFLDNNETSSLDR